MEIHVPRLYLHYQQQSKAHNWSYKCYRRRTDDTRMKTFTDKLSLGI